MSLDLHRDGPPATDAADTTTWYLARILERLDQLVAFEERKVTAEQMMVDLVGALTDAPAEELDWYRETDGRYAIRTPEGGGRVPTPDEAAQIAAIVGSRSRH
jgi:hypothetical protein